MTRTLKIMAVAFALLAFSGVALYADDLNLGPNFVSVNMSVNGGASQSLGGGSIGPSTLNGDSLYVYCVDLWDTINVPGDYNTTTVTHDASMTGLTNDGEGLTGGKVNNAGAVAYLLQTYAAGATTTDKQAALQAAIWHEIYGSNAVLGSGNDSNIVTDYGNYLTGVGSGNIAAFNWMSPGTGLQGLVGGPVPDGGMTLMLLGGTLVGVGTLRRKFRV